MTATTSPAADATVLELLLDPAGRKDPYPRYRRLREEAPVLRTAFGPVVLTRYADCQAALRDPCLGRGSRGTSLLAGSNGEVSEVRRRMADTQRHTMLFANPPEHTRLRRLVSREFTPGRVDALRPAVQQMVDGILDAMAGAGEVDAMAVLAFPLPVTVIGELLGIPEADRAGFQPLVQRAVVSLEANATDEQLEDAQAAAIDMAVYFSDLLAERRRTPAGDLLSALATAADADDRLTEEEVIATSILLFAAGFETTTNLIGNGLWALLRHPDQLDRLRADPGLASSAVEEILRFDSPVQVNGRSALVEAEIAGEPLAVEDVVICLQGAANWDPDRFPDPERFDIGRDQGPPLSFGSGIHHCLGAGLARMEGHVVLRSLVDRFRTIEALVDAPEQRAGLTLRGLAVLPVAWRPDAGGPVRSAPMPLRHLVLIELKPETTAEVRDELVTRLRALPDLIDAIRGYEVVVDLGLQDGNATVGVVATFDDVEGWRSYGPHPAHQAVVQELIQPNAARRTALQGDLPTV